MKWKYANISIYFPYKMYNKYIRTIDGKIRYIYFNIFLVY